MAKSFKVEVNPGVLVWARETAGYNMDEVALRTGQTGSSIRAWESGRRQPSWKLLSKLAALYKRPVAALLLPEPPQEAKTLPDFRTLPGGAGQFAPEIRFAIRTARWLAAKAAELQQELQSQARFSALRLDLSGDPEKAADAARAALGVTLDEQAGFSSAWAALRRWRAAVEAQHVLVFQFRMPVEDARGFSLVEVDTPAIVLNQSDAPAARIFTLLHEYAHVLLARPGVCLPEPTAAHPSQTIEKFCNRFAAAVLVPQADFKAHIPATPSDGALRQLARHYSVSRYVVLGRMWELDVISARTHQRIRSRWQEQDAGAARRPTGGAGLKAPARCLLERGKPFVSLVIEAAKRELITFSDANIYLGVKLKDFRQLAKGA